MIQRDVDATLLPQTCDVQVTEWTFVPTSSKTPDTPAYYISRVSVRSHAGEVSEEAIIPLHDLQSAERAAREELVRRTLHTATLKAKARLDAPVTRQALRRATRRAR